MTGFDRRTDHRQLLFTLTMPAWLPLLQTTVLEVQEHDCDKAGF